MAQPTTLPIIDISPFLLPSNPAARQATATSIHNAIVKFGFLYITGVESVVLDLEEPLDVAREFFGRPAEEKAKLRIRAGDGARGYQVGLPSHTTPRAPTRAGLGGDIRW